MLAPCYPILNLCYALSPLPSDTLLLLKKALMFDFFLFIQAAPMRVSGGLYKK